MAAQISGFCAAVVRWPCTGPQRGPVQGEGRRDDCEEDPIRRTTQLIRLLVAPRSQVPAQSAPGRPMTVLRLVIAHPPVLCVRCKSVTRRQPGVTGHDQSTKAAVLMHQCCMGACNSGNALE